MSELKPEKPKSWSVSKYLEAFKRKVIVNIPCTWVHGVITQMQDKGSAVYLSIAEFKEGDVKAMATLPLMVWKSDYNRILARIAAEGTPLALKPELKVSLYVEPDIYFPSGKFQCKILDIDPQYTLGELALTREAILKRLRAEGLLRKNAELPFPQVPLHIGLITGEGTAAFHDFTKTLADSGFAFKVTPAYARMQGNETENSILLALGRLLQNSDIDVVCIIRGGGSKTDLSYFDSEALCRAVANYSLPVLTGIGHEIDTSLLDQVAWQSCITPTDCAKFLIERVAESWQRTRDLAMEIAGRIQARLPYEQERQRRIRDNVERSVSRLIIQEQENIASLSKLLIQSPERLFQNEHDVIERYADGLKNGSRKILELANKNFELQELRVKTVDPQTILKKGYSLTLDSNGKVIRGAANITSGTLIVTRFADGDVRSIVE